MALPTTTGGWGGASLGTQAGGRRKRNEWEEIIGTMPSITGEQAAVSTPLSEYLAEAIAGVGEQPTFEEWSQQAGAVPDVFGGQLGAQAKGVYAEAMRGAFPEQYYQEAVYKPTMTEWERDIMPTVKESYVATGAITGTEVGDKIAREAGRLGQSLAGIKAGLAEQQKVRSLTAAGQYQAAYAETLKLAYSNYIKQNPAASEILQAALSYLNIPMMAAYQKPGDQTAAATTAGVAPKKDYYEWVGGQYQNVGQTPQMII